MDRFISKQRRHAEETAKELGDYAPKYCGCFYGKPTGKAKPTPNFEFSPDARKNSEKKEII